MLAFMPPPASISQPGSLSSMASDRASLALLPPTSLSYNQPPNAFPASPSPSKRPKLTLNTCNISQGSTSLRLETLSATSPTHVNTFQNRQTAQPAIGAKPTRPTLTPLAINVERSPADLPTPPETPLPDSPDTSDEGSSPAASATSVTTVDSCSSEPPYKLSYNTTSILTNGPIPRTNSRRLSFSQSRPVFPTPKKVGFRAPLTEEIQTTQFTLRHSDIEATFPVVDVSGTAEQDAPANAETASPSTSVQTGSKRDSLDVEKDETCAQTPVAGRAKRQKWVWTLEPVRYTPAGEPVE